MRLTFCTVLTLALLAGVAAFFAAPVDALSNCISCTTVESWGPPNVTVVTGEHDNDCEWAEMDAYAKADQLCDPHGFCSRSQRFISSCHNGPDPDGIFRADLEVTYYCRVCLDTRAAINPDANDIDRMLEGPSGECPAPVVAAE